MAERPTKYPQASLDIMAEFAVVFHRALSVLSVLVLSPVYGLGVYGVGVQGSGLSSTALYPSYPS